MIIRLSKILCVAAVAFFGLLVVFGNVTDYYTNYFAVEQTLMMKGIFPNSTISYRAINAPILQHLAYVIITTCEALTTIFCIMGAVTLFRARSADAAHFNQAKKWAIVGLTLGFLTWQVLFMTIGGEWFGLWMTPLKEAIPSAFHMFMTFLVVLIYVAAKDE